MARDKQADRPQEAVNGANDASRKDVHGRCRVCLKPLPPGSPLRRSCDGACRLRAWAVEELKRALAAGEAEGLRPELSALGSSTLTVKVVKVVDSGRGTDIEDRRS